MRVLVTGAGGLIGRSVVRQLVERGHRVRAVDRKLHTGKSMLSEPIQREVEWIEADTRSEALFDASAGVRSAVHLAAGPSFLMYEKDPIRQTAGAIQGFHNLLEAGRRHQLDSIVYASTSAVYEGNPLPYQEDMEVKPPDLKALAKKVNEEMADLYSDRYGVRMLGLRPFSVYGTTEMPKGHYANVLSLFAWALCGGKTPVVWGDGRQTRDFIFVDDVARAFVLAVESSLPTQVLNVGTGVETTFNDALTLLGNKLGLEVEPKYVSVPITVYARRLLADVSRAEERLGFIAKVSLESGVEQVLASAEQALHSGIWPGLAEAQEAGLTSVR